MEQQETGTANSPYRTPGTPGQPRRAWVLRGIKSEEGVIVGGCIVGAAAIDCFVGSMSFLLYGLIPFTLRALVLLALIVSFFCVLFLRREATP